MQRSGKPITEDTVAERTNDFTQSYAAAVVQLGQELKLPVVDLWSSMQTQPDWQNSFLCDGLHLTPAGNTFVYDQLQPAINKAYPDLRYELIDALGMRSPWAEIICRLSSRHETMRVQIVLRW